MHEHGIPDRGDWPDGVLEAVACFRQGDLVPELPLFYWADPGHAVHLRTRAYADGTASPEVVSFADPAPYGLITTQTCDLAQEGDGRPNSAWVQLAPVFDALAPHPLNPDRHLLDGGARRLIEQGRDQYRLRIPSMPDARTPTPGCWFADLTFEVTVERGWLATRDRIDGFGDDEQREQVARRLAWLRARPAFDSRFVRAVQRPMIGSLRELRRNDRAAYERMHEQVLEVGVQMNSRLAVTQAELAVLHVGADADLLQWWHDLWPALHRRAEDEGFNLLALRIADLRDLPTLEYRKLTRVPLSNVSPNPAWYGADPIQDAE